MRKLLILCLAIVTAALLTACGGKETMQMVTQLK